MGGLIEILRIDNKQLLDEFLWDTAFTFAKLAMASGTPSWSLSSIAVAPTNFIFVSISS
jgi:hypothetical protein